MSTFRVEIETDSAAFDDDGAGHEVARILRKLAERIENGHTSAILRDVNGNRVGFATFSEEE